MNMACATTSNANKTILSVCGSGMTLRSTTPSKSKKKIR